MRYTGNSSYCYSNSLHMCLQDAGMIDLPDASFLECLTGMPFGACFLKLDMPIFFPSPAKTSPDRGLSQALKTLGWSSEVWRGDDAQTARAKLEAVLKSGPVLLGPIDMGFLKYDPIHKNKGGTDHFVVILSVENDMAQLHDPQFFPFTTLPMDDLMAAWNASSIDYANNAYTMHYGFREERKVSRAEMVKATLEIAQELQADYPEEPFAYGGPSAFRQVLEVLEGTPSPEFAGFLAFFALPIGARRSLDAANFMKEAGEAELAQLYERRAKLFGNAQYYATTQQWSKLTDPFKSLAEVEGQLVEKISQQ